MRKVYFAGSIRGGRGDAELYARIIDHIKRHAVVLTEHVGDPSVASFENGNTEEYIYSRDMAWLAGSDFVVAECTSPSIGVGYELASAERLGKPCFVLYDSTRSRLSAMIAGDPFFRVIPYDSDSSLFQALDRILGVRYASGLPGRFTRHTLHWSLHLPYFASSASASILLRTEDVSMFFFEKISILSCSHGAEAS